MEFPVLKQVAADRFALGGIKQQKKFDPSVCTKSLGYVTAMVEVLEMTGLEIVTVKDMFTEPMMLCGEASTFMVVTPKVGAKNK